MLALAAVFCLQICMQPLFASAQGAAADSESGEPSEGAVGLEEEGRVGWAPEFGFSWGVHNQQMDGFTRSPTSPDPLDDDGDSIISQYFSLEFNLYTPLQLDVPTKPRFLFTSSIQVPLADELISNRLNDSRNDFDPDFSSFCPSTIPGNPGGPDVVPTTCSVALRNRVTPNVMWTAGVGVDFTFEFSWLDQDIHLIPTFDYMGQMLQPEGSFRRTSTRAGFSDFKERVEQTDSSEVYHGISPSLTLAVDVFEEGPVSMTLFLGARVAWMLTDKDISANANTSLGPFTFPTQPNDFFVQGRGGATIRYNGFR